MLTNWGSFCRMPRWSEVSVNLAEVKKDAQVVGGGARCRPRWRWSLGQYQSGARCRTQVVEGGGGAAHHLHLRLPQHPAQTGRQLGLWNKPGPLILLQNPNDPIIITIFYDQFSGRSSLPVLCCISKPAQATTKDALDPSPCFFISKLVTRKIFALVCQIF